jgi:hypothetical protein
VILIIGCMRSGTLFTTKLIRKLTRLRMGHDALETDGGVSGFFAGAIGHNPARGAKEGILQYTDLILHQVRHPLKVVRSMEAINEPTWEWICNQLPDMCSMEQPLVERASRYWVRWNQHCEEIAALTYRVESLVPIARAAGIKTSWNSRAYEYETPVLTWDDIPRDIVSQMRELAEHYGYEEE